MLMCMLDTLNCELNNGYSIEKRIDQSTINSQKCVLLIQNIFSKNISVEKYSFIKEDHQ